jgi:hypothetical protein
MLHKDIKHYYKARIISKQTDCGIPTRVMLVISPTTKGVLIELHKFWFYYDDLSHCVGETSRKYAFDRPVLSSLWPVQAWTNLTQIEVVALEEFVFCY